MSCSPDACELTLDPNTAYRYLSLSEDNRKVTLLGQQQSYPDHPEKFDYWDQVLCRESLTGRCYWEVERIGCVVIGVTYRGITRRGWGADSGLEGTTSPGVFIVLMLVTLPGTTIVLQTYVSPPLALTE